MENIFEATIFIRELGNEWDGDVIAYTAHFDDIDDALMFAGCTPEAYHCTGAAVTVRRLDASNDFQIQPSFHTVEDWNMQLPSRGAAGFSIKENGCVIAEEFWGWQPC